MAATRQRAKTIPIIEWMTAAAGLAIVLGSIGFIAYGTQAGNGSRPALDVSVETGHETANGYATVVLVRNAGREAAADVVVEGILHAGADTVRSEARLSYVPGLSARRATLVFPVRPEPGRLDLRVTGYSTP